MKYKLVNKDTFPTLAGKSGRRDYITYEIYDRIQEIFELHKKIAEK